MGSDGRVRVRENEAGRKEKREEEEAEDSSIRFRRAIMNSIIANWNRSTISVKFQRPVRLSRGSFLAGGDHSPAQVT